MGFWDYQNDQQLAHDNEIYPVTRKDADIAQKGSVRIVTNRGRQYQSFVLENQTHIDFLTPTTKSLVGQRRNVLMSNTQRLLNRDLFLPEVSQVRIPGTNVVLKAQK